MKYTHLLAGLFLACGLQTVYAADVRYGVICYHDVIDGAQSLGSVDVANDMADMKGEMKRQYFPQTITVERLTAHFNWLRDNGYTPVSFKQIEDARAGKGELPPKPVLLTFDDGYASFYTKIYPLLKAYNYPAVFALVTSWLEQPEGSMITYGKEKLPRSAFITWAQMREMVQSGLVEVASHTHDLHHSVTGNPYGTQFAAMFPEYKNGRYETKAEYEKRIRDDLQKSVDIITKRTGFRPNVLVWPYGQFSQEAQAIAHSVGLTNDFTLFDNTLNTVEQHSIGRALVDNETGYALMKAYLDEAIYTPPHQRAMYIDLDSLYDADPKKLESKFDKLIERVYKMGVTTVYLQAFSDEDGDGLVDSAYFPNRHLKMKADLFSRVAWQMMTRSGVKVYAQMPMTAFDLGDGYEYITDKDSGRTSARKKLYLSPSSSQNRQAVVDLYEDLAFNSRFNGLVFGEDSLIAGDGGNIAMKRPVSDVVLEGQQRSNLINYSNLLKQAVLKYSFNGPQELKTVRNLYVEGNDIEVKQRLTAYLPLFTQNYNYTAIIAMPYESGGVKTNRQAAEKWMSGLVADVKDSGVPLDKTVFELQSVDVDTRQPIDSREMVSWMQLLRKEGVKNLAYSPDDYLGNQPLMENVRPIFSVK
ncbi:poly-beta-1,6-N-acetyl-D-glucosamine N-deacetylase PgaB [Neisseria montereyensis]|uniref:Poly-beta-1,6-N-acetyl-D-glucosamine N-deacetylase PgaB n=1 Tax=Neisseria montereyensis TaxID=2973938 RepID=A0ABT2FA71_9NEIS|nr:poly-beta-1,6-N-acetyl-D-glucosamine N-deacetylase PgaB [Neisseria montereyensis]MCS4532846.1 poly-beta-1,6-N-acetyl-D-glucosamine N-deacetylase PgaB [Neisseria montereyensis]